MKKTFLILALLSLCLTKMAIAKTPVKSPTKGHPENAKVPTDWWCNVRGIIHVYVGSDGTYYVCHLISTQNVCFALPPNCIGTGPSGLKEFTDLTPIPQGIIIPENQLFWARPVGSSWEVNLVDNLTLEVDPDSPADSIILRANNNNN